MSDLDQLVNINVPGCPIHSCIMCPLLTHYNLIGVNIFWKQDSLEKDILSQTPGDLLGIYWERINPTYLPWE